MEWKQATFPDLKSCCSTLETFLSGMETVHQADQLCREVDLETFLSGMETAGEDGQHQRAFHALKPSLVEWKPPTTRATRRTTSPLETFLSGMETSLYGIAQSNGATLKPSLVEWKLVRDDRGLYLRVDP